MAKKNHPEARPLTTEELSKLQQHDAAGLQAAVFIIAGLITGGYWVAKGKVVGAVPFLGIGLGCALIWAANLAKGRRANLLRALHFSFSTAAISWALVDFFVYHALRYAIATAFFGAWILFSWKANTYSHWREWSIAYWRLSGLAAIVACISGALDWRLQAICISGSITLALAAIKSIFIDQRRWREQPADALPPDTRVRDQLITIVGCSILSLFSIALLILSLINGYYQGVGAAAIMLAFFLSIPLLVVWLAAKSDSPESVKARQQQRATKRQRIADREQLREERRQAIADAVEAAHGGLRPWLLGCLSQRADGPIAVILAVTIGVAIAVLSLLYHSSRGDITSGDVYWDCGGAAVIAIIAIHFLRRLLRYLVSAIRWSLWRTAVASREPARNDP